MNQILAVENKKNTKSKNSGGPMEIKKVAKIFAILILIFGLIMVGEGIFGMVNKNKKDPSATVPTVTMQQEGNKLKISIKHDKAIDKIIYSWNNAQTGTTLQGKGRNDIEETIELLSGTNTIYLKVIDMFGSANIYEKEIKTPEGDITDPEIEFTVEDSKIKITAKDETKLAYLSYHWNDEEETKLEAREDSPKIIEEKITILKGENTLTVIAVDQAGNQTEKTQTFKGAKKPTVELTREGSNIIIKVTDEENIQKVEFTLNGQLYSTDPNNTGTPLDMKEFVITQPLAAGANTIVVKAYNVSGLQTEKSGEANIE